MNGTVSLRSFGVRPGVTNRHSWNSTIGSAMANPAYSAIFRRIRNGPTTPWTNTCVHEPTPGGR